MVLLALPAVDIALLALLCALIYFGTPIIVKLITTVIPDDLPVIGGRLANAVANAGHKAEAAMKRAIYAQLHWAAKMIRYPIASVKAPLNYIAITVASLYSAAHRITTVTIPHQVSAIMHRVNVLHATETAYVKHEVAILVHRENVLYQEGISFTKGQVASVRKSLLAAIVATANSAKAQIGAVVHKIDTVRVAILAAMHAADQALAHQAYQYYSAALGFTRDAVANLSHHVDQLYHQALAHADAAAGAAASTAVGALEHETAVVLSAAWPGLLSDVQALEGALAGDLEHIGAAVRKIDLTKARTIADGLAVSTAVGVVALRYMKECGVPNCKNLGGFGHILHDLGLIIGGEALFEFVKEFATDPDGAAHTVIDEAGEVVQDLTGSFLHLIGL